MKLDPGKVIPALVKALSSTNVIRPQCAAFALADYGPLARPALPTRTNWLNNGVEWRHSIATNALHAIDPHSFTNAGPMKFRVFVPPQP